MARQRKWQWVLALVAVCLLAVGGGWILTRPRTDDAKADRLVLLKSTEATSSKSNEQGGNPQARDLCGGTGGIGRIISVGTNTFTIKRKNGQDQIVNLTGQTTIKTLAGLASQSDLKTGDAVTLIGGPNPDGSFTADTVVVCGGISPKTQ